MMDDVQAPEHFSGYAEEVLGHDQHLADLGAVSEWIGFSASCIKSGEPWTATCEKMRDEARAALARLSAPPPPAGSDGWREALEAWRLTDGYHPAYLAGWNAMLDKALALPTPPVAPRG